MNKAFILVGLSAGDESKGSTTDYLCRKYDCKTVIRYSGASQCGHNVVTPDNKYHCFSQFGAGTFAGAKTFLSQYMLIGPIGLMEEAKKLSQFFLNPYNDLYISEDATVITPYHAITNQLIEEKRNKNNHGSCGKGVGQCRKDQLSGLSLKIKDLRNVDLTKEKLIQIRERKIKELREEHGIVDHPHLVFEQKKSLDNTIYEYNKFLSLVNVVHSNKINDFLEEGNVVFEGAQGVLLDEKWGFEPYNTWTDVTFNNAFKLLKDYNGETIRIGLCRSYMTRHGPGPFVTESQSINLSEPHNPYNRWQGNFRQGHLDLIALLYSISVCGGIDCLGISHLDCIKESNKVCYGYSNISEEYYKDGLLLNKPGLTDALFNAKPVYKEVTGNDLIDFIEGYLGIKIKILSHGQTWKDKISFL